MKKTPEDTCVSQKSLFVHYSIVKLHVYLFDMNDKMCKGSFFVIKSANNATGYINTLFKFKSTFQSCNRYFILLLSRLKKSKILN